MKKLLLVSIAVFVSLFASCSSDDDSSNGSSNSIIGTWQTQSISFDGGEDEANSCDRMDTLTFTETTVSTKSFDIAEINSDDCELVFENTLNYTISGNTILLEGQEEDDDLNTFVVNGDTLIITFIDTPISDEFEDEITVTTYRRI